MDPHLIRFFPKVPHLMRIFPFFCHPVIVLLMDGITAKINDLLLCWGPPEGPLSVFGPLCFEV